MAQTGRWLLLAALLCFASAPDPGMAQGPTPPLSPGARVPLDTGNAVIGFRVYGFGLIPVNGHFTRFRGTWHGDPHDAAACSVDLTADIASLVMPTDAMRTDALAPGLLDSAAFPTMAFQGSCAGDRLSGQLTLHGFRGLMNFTVRRRAGQLAAEGSLRRAEWGMTGSSGMVGNTVEIEISLRDTAVNGR